jgi:hypothetical protein
LTILFTSLDVNCFFFFNCNTVPSIFFLYSVSFFADLFLNSSKSFLMVVISLLKPPTIVASLSICSFNVLRATLSVATFFCLFI